MRNKLKLCLILIFIFVCSSCDIITQLTCKHEYETISSEDSTCTKKGKIAEICNKCNKEKTTKLDLLPHNYEESIISPTCTDKGYTLAKCKVCSYEIKEDYVEALGHKLSEWTIVNNPTEIADGLKKRSCSECDYEEKEIIISNSYIDLDAIKFDYNNSKTYEANSTKELQVIYDAAILNLSNKVTVDIGFTSFDLNTLLSTLVDNCNIPFRYKVNASLLGSKLTLTFTYSEYPITSTQNIVYTQHNSLNYIPNSSTRVDSYNEFNINNSLYTFKVSTSEQLYYALERGVLPICEKNSQAEKIYNEMLKVLKQIINDDMTNQEKVKAIHDYLILNVTYDNELLDLLYTGQDNLSDYNGFYLEGVFLDKKAVCEGISKAFTAMCNIEGIPCVCVEGYQTQNPNGAGHAWNKVYLDGKWYIVDVTSDGTIINKSFEILSYKYFLISESEYITEYTGTTFTNIVCNSDINAYSLYKFQYKNNEYDYNIESQDELNTLVAYFNANNTSPLTIEFYLDFDYGDSCLDEIKKAYSYNKIYSSYSYIDNGSVFMLIK